MEEAIQAFVFFWFAGLLALFGLMFAFFSKAATGRKIGSIMLAIGLLSLLATPWTIPFSPSSAFGHLLGSIIGPTVLLGVGFYQIAFSGHVPVGRLSKGDRNVGVIMVLIGVLWIEAMHWFVLTPVYPDEVNRYWMIFCPTLLLFGMACSTGAYAMVGLVGNERHQERRLMLLLTVFFSALIVLGARLDGPNVEHEQFAVELFLSGADLFGVAVGAAFSMLLFALVMVVYEAQQPAPPRLAPPTTEELQQAATTIATHVETGGEEDE
jgi:hypothetical protein